MCCLIGSLIKSSHAANLSKLAQTMSSFLTTKVARVAKKEKRSDWVSGGLYNGVESTKGVAKNFKLGRLNKNYAFIC